MLTGESQLQLNNHALTVVNSGQPVEMKTPEVEMGDDTGTAKELWEGLGDKGEDVGNEDKEGAGGGNENEDESEGEGEDTGGDLVSAIFS